MTDAAAIADERLQRFLRPRHVLQGEAPGAIVGRADTPAADAVCEIHLGIDAGRIVEARFAAYGAPLTVACADWLCEYISGRTIAATRGLSTQDMQAALALAAEERFAAMLALDALHNALERIEA